MRSPLSAMYTKVVDHHASFTPQRQTRAGFRCQACAKCAQHLHAFVSTPQKRPYQALTPGRKDGYKPASQDKEDSPVEGETSDGQEPDSPGVRAALSALRWYKSAISPLLPPSCRFLPTCSEYSMQAYKQFGVAKGTVLTAWRLARCNPIGGSGYDPPQWPPRGIGLLFQYEKSAEVAVAAGMLLVVYTIQHIMEVGL